jgi:NADPH:quinone reductase-like Zn-dependent oxidoreductase
MIIWGMRIYPLAGVLLLAAPGGAGAAADEATMRAALVSAATIRVREVARPVAGPGQVLVRIRYAGVNPADWKSAGGKPEDPTARAPGAIPGVDGSGVISALGSGVAGYKIGDPVIVWSPTGGTYAQYVAVAADGIAHKPDSLSFAEAAGVAHAGLAAWNMLIDQAAVRAGQSVLVLGGAGGVGSAAVQIAKLKGARVIATASARNADYLRSLGADTVFDYTTQHFEDQLRNIDIAIDTVDVDNAYRALAVVRRGGYLLSSVGLPAAGQCAARAVTCADRSRNGTPVHLVLQQIADWSQAGRFKVNVDRSFALSEVLQAWQYSQAGHTRGKSVIRMDD